ncbi:MAG: hypothetical protein V3T59_00400 [Desulfobacterales bacterium]
MFKIVDVILKKSSVIWLIIQIRSGVTSPVQREENESEKYDSSNTFHLLFFLLFTARVEVIEIITEKNRVRLKTTCTNQDETQVLDGEAVTSPPKMR